MAPNAQRLVPSRPDESIPSVGSSNTAQATLPGRRVASGEASRNRFIEESGLSAIRIEPSLGEPHHQPQLRPAVVVEALAESGGAFFVRDLAEGQNRSLPGRQPQIAIAAPSAKSDGIRLRGFGRSLSLSLSLSSS